MTQRLDLFFDFRSPYSYLAFTQLRQMDVDIALRPMQVLKVMDAVGNVPTTITCAAKGRYARQDLMRWTQRYGITLNPSDMRANDGDACARAVLAAPSPVEASSITLALFRACWSEGKTLANSTDVLAAVAAAGINAAPISARIGASDVAAQFDANTSEASERGVFGAPTMFVEGAMFFGNDRLEFVREALDRRGDAA